MIALTDAADSVISMLRALEVGGAALLVGDGVAPVGAPSTDDEPFTPYCVFYQLAGGSFDGSMAVPNTEMVWWPFQVTSVGQTAEQASALSDLTAAALLVRNAIVVPGAEVMRVMRVLCAGVSRDDDANPPLFYVPDLYRLYLNSQ